MEITRPRGTRDFLFEEMKKRKEVEKTLKRIFETYGYHEIKTPIFEDLKLFTLKSGEEIIKQIYHFKDKANRDLALRPELTAPVARLYLNEMRKHPKPIKLYYYGSCFRYERPQAGRFRQFWQFGCELMGAESPQAEAEVIALAAHCLRELGLKEYKLHIGHLGILRGILEDAGIKGESQDKIMSLIDKGDLEGLKIHLENIKVDKTTENLLLSIIGMKGGLEVLEDLESMVGGCEPAMESINDLRKLISLLDDFKVEDYNLNLGIARGLDYYTGIVFEIYVPSLGAQKQICGGGTYNLIELFSGEKIQSTGFAFGFDRLVAALKKQKGEIFQFAKVFVAPVSDSTRPSAYRIVQELREAGIPSDVDLSSRKLRKILSYADHLNVEKVILVGERDLKDGKVTIKDMKTGSQKLVEIDKIIEYLKEE
ncbi:MAG TPA: histidine--tRNA ligase [Methanothermobacter sp.]|jgi:histidyl-tRNA synthetase|uniref:Histidine--tRNA ligase n=1 Tax=Methanothermobacter tenebrarum TaxID=680118 RepID=A0ABM7YE16_9EURY|nr:histidine--tRNA ligase [Methanothermobacter tenebrarum]MDD3454776.1 histidine--tRNA ligase [Methanobacteriales archaeon]MDX9693484.1 histidine--tRNA ligase [Methanothermobacter sp.]BDH79508.1 histidine--tRNA ligase [Methanothermobacter tenebrarum]HHW15772.1 histidine--tRNA ligase [Methanothermobacter sp.]HOQ19996.1 histidine--tRNA ligase [Methanothermobacter sp.]